MKTVQMVILPRWGVTIRPREVGILALLRSGENVVVRNPDRWPWYAELHANPALSIPPCYNEDSFPNTTSM